MFYSPALLFIDAATAVIMLVLASLSKGLGNALKIRPYYRLLYFSAGLVLAASLMSAVYFDCAAAGKTCLVSIAAPAARLTAGITAFFVCMRYWKWLFSEFFKR
jgi:hypothetical protein